MKLLLSWFCPRSKAWESARKLCYTIGKLRDVTLKELKHSQMHDLFIVKKSISHFQYCTIRSTTSSITIYQPCKPAWAVHLCWIHRSAKPPQDQEFGRFPPPPPILKLNFFFIWFAVTESFEEIADHLVPQRYVLQVLPPEIRVLRRFVARIMFPILQMLC